jgi:hypothetical protein
MRTRTPRESVKAARRTDDYIRLNFHGNRYTGVPRCAFQAQVMWFDIVGSESTKLVDDVQIAKVLGYERRRIKRDAKIPEKDSTKPPYPNCIQTELCIKRGTCVARPSCTE